MNRKGWTFIFVYSSPLKTVSSITIPRFLLLFIFLFCCAGLVGLGRAVVKMGVYTTARVGVDNEAKKNKDLMQKLVFLKRLTLQHTKQLENLISLENKGRLMFGMNAIDDDVRKAGVGGIPPRDNPANLSGLFEPNIREAIELENELVELVRRAKLQNATFVRMIEHATRQNDSWSQIPSIWPVKGRVTSGYGYRLHPIFNRTMFHEGLDIANLPWTPIQATADGIVEFTGTKHDFGNVVKIDHTNGYETVYAHLQKIAVVEGQPVRRGEVVGYLGKTGRTTGPHLHYEVRKLNRHVNPRNYILPDDTMID